MIKTLGIDLGTNSIGWALVEKDGDITVLRDYGVHIFQEGVAKVKGNEEPMVKTRTAARSSRRHYFRRRLRKINLLRILVREGWCPFLSEDDLRKWKEEKKYPLTKAFLEWQRTDDGLGKNPYKDRHECLSKTLDLNTTQDAYVLGRALYHLNQRRGFLSNRKEQSSEDESGKVNFGIDNLDAAIKSAGCTYLGEYFYKIYGTDEKIRNQYTARIRHYEKEFFAICKKQNLPDTLVEELHRAIFYQRPLKSQKGLVGKCKFEKDKPRCPLSHPDFEEFRMLAFINNIRVAYPGEKELRPLTEEERSIIAPLFYRKTKIHFDFSEIGAKLFGKKAPINYGGELGGNADVARFNFRRNTTVTGCPFTSGLISAFGDDWRSALMSLYVKAEGKTERQIVNDVWHVLFSFDNDDCVIKWAEDYLQLDNSRATAFAKATIQQGYAALSLKAINKILVWLRLGYRYDEAVMLANVPYAMGMDIRNDAAKLNEAIEVVKQTITSYLPNPDINKDSKYRKIEEDLCNAGIVDFDMAKFYHPSMIETFPKVVSIGKTPALLPSPRVQSIRNPMAMRALFRLRALMNELIKKQEIDKNTHINIELSRNLNDSNKRKAIEWYQRENEKKRSDYQKKITEFYKQAGFNHSPSDDDILKYELWEEQNHICLYTGKTIGISDFLGADPKFDIEHTIPRSRGGDDSKANKTLCDKRFNRDVKKDRLPSELVNSTEIMTRIESLTWRDRISELRIDIEKRTRESRMAADKDSKDRAITRRHLAKMSLDYYLNKLDRFKMIDVPAGFSNRQGVDIGIIGRYARMYLASVFDHIYTVKGETTATFRKMWGLQGNYEKKDRVNHSHHCIDAITIACIGKKEYERWAKYKEDYDKYMFYGAARPAFQDRPWGTFVEDVKNISDNLIVSHHNDDRMAKKAKKKLRVRGIIQHNENGKPKYAIGHTARGPLHMQTFYGAIERNGEIRYVVRKELAALDAKDIKNIVDDVVRKKVEEAIKARSIAALRETIWMNEEKRIPIKKVRLYTTDVKNPIKLKEHRDKSIHEYRNHYYVKNETNYAIGLYDGFAPNGKYQLGKDFIVISNLAAAKRINDVSNHGILLPNQKNNLSLRYTLRLGTLVLFYEKNKEEILSCSLAELSRRLYKLVGISTLRVSGYEYGSLKFLHHQDARPSSEITFTNGHWKSADDFRPAIIVQNKKFSALVEGYDFIIDCTGKISFKN